MVKKATDEKKNWVRNRAGKNMEALTKNTSQKQKGNRKQKRGRKKNHGERIFELKFR